MTQPPLYIDDPDAIVSASMLGEYDLVEAMLKQSADLDVRDEDGNTALIVAAKEGYHGIVEMLLEHGAQVNARNDDGDSAIDLAKFRECGDIVELLRGAGAEEREGPSALEQQWDQAYEGFAQANAVKRLIGMIDGSQPSGGKETKDSMTEALEIPTAMQLRTELEEMVRRDLLGPAGGPHEEIDERNVRGRYIAGLLAPRGQSLLPDEQDDLPVDGAGDDQDGKTDTVIPQTASMLPSSIGLTFSVDDTAPAIQITARWGTYKRTRSETILDDKGEPRLVWKRRPVEAESDPVPLRTGGIGPWFPDAGNEDVHVRGLCRRREGAWTVTLFLVNAQQEPKARKDEAWLFQPGLAVRAPDGTPDGGAVFVKRQLPPELGSDEAEDRAMSMLYRHEVEFAVGHGVAVQAKPADGTWERAVEVRTEVMPAYEVERMEPPTTHDFPLLGKAVLDMKVLAKMEMEGFAAALSPLTQAYGTWIEAQAGELAAARADLSTYQADAEAALANCREAQDRIQAGIALLESDAQAAQAFRFANRAMHLQRVRSIYTRLVRQGQQPDLATIDVPQNRSWYPFQLAFVLLNLPGLVDPAHPDRSHPTQALADLLWFPTGGGKTEAYLGVAAFAMGIRRLQGEIGERSGHAGVTVLMRYTLRLLTLQQFQRAAALTAILNMAIWCIIGGSRERDKRGVADGKTCGVSRDAGWCAPEFGESA